MNINKMRTQLGLLLPYIQEIRQWNYLESRTFPEEKKYKKGLRAGDHYLKQIKDFLSGARKTIPDTRTMATFFETHHYELDINIKLLMPFDEKAQFIEAMRQRTLNGISKEERLKIIQNYFETAGENEINKFIIENDLI